MSIIIDLIVLAIIGLFIYTSAKRGFVKVLVEVAGFVLAVIITFTISSPLADATYDKIIEPSILEAVGDSAAGSAEELKNEALSALPEFVTKNAELLGFSVDEFANKINTDVLSSTAQNPVKLASQEVVKPVVSRIIELLYSIILMLILLFVVKLLARVINKMFTFSIIGKANSFLGGVIGVPKGIIIAMIFCMIISLCVSFFGEFFIFTYENMENTLLFKLFADIAAF